MNNGDIVAIKFCQSVLGKKVCMVWTVTLRDPQGAIDLRWILEKLKPIVTPKLGAVQHVYVGNVSIGAENLTNKLEFAEVSWDGGGFNTGEMMPRFVAYGFTLLRTDKRTRVGAKRVPGVPEIANVDGNLRPDFYPGLNDLGQFWSSSHVLTGNEGSVTVMPVIVGRTKSGDYDLSKVQPVTGFSLKGRLTTQNSRK